MKIALIELSESHEECLYSQVQFIGLNNPNVHLYLNPKVALQVEGYGLDKKQIFETQFDGGFFKRWSYAFYLAKTLGKYDRLVFNTASSSKLLRNLLILLNFYSVVSIGVLHNTKKLGSSFTQRLVSTKIKKYLVLSDHLTNPPNLKKGIRLQSFYPIYFPDYNDFLEKPEDETWLVIPGSIDFKRRDYLRLLDSLYDRPVISKLKIILLGRLNDSFEDGRGLLEAISKRKLNHYFVTFESFVANKTFHSYVGKADFIMPLLALNDDYLNYKISGSFNMAFAYKKYMLTHKFYGSLPDLSENSVFYDESNLYDQLCNLKTVSVTKHIYQNEKWHFGFQKKRYLDFLLSE